VRDVLERAKNGRLYVIVGPSYRSLKDSTFRSFLDVAEQLRCLISLNRTDFYATVLTKDGGEAQINFRSADKPESLRGPNISGCLCDEASLYAKEAIDVVIPCLREGGEMGWLSMTFTPKGKGHWTYEWFFDDHGNPRVRTELFRASSRDNPYLPPEFYDIIADRYVPGSRLAKQELEGQFVDLVGLLFQWAWFQRIDRTGIPGVNAPRVRYWDKAGTEEGGDYSAGVLLSRGEDGVFYVEDVVRGQWSAHNRNRRIRAVAARDASIYHNQVIIWIEQEPGSGGKESAAITVNELAQYPVYVETVSGDKVTRAMPFCAQCEAGNVRVVDSRMRKGDLLPWTDDFLSELCSFPEGKHDDQVDAVCGAYNKLAIMTAGQHTSAVLVAYPESPESSPEPSPEDGRRNAKRATNDEIKQKMEAIEKATGGELDLSEYLAEYSAPSARRSAARKARRDLIDRYSNWMFGD